MGTFADASGALTAAGDGVAKVVIELPRGEGA